MWIRDNIRTITPLVIIVCIGYNASTSLVGEGISGGYAIQRLDSENVTKSPWHAGLYITTTNPYRQICGGTVIARNVVITAAHCISQDRHKPPVSRFAVAAGKIYRPWNDSRDEGAQKSDVKEIKIPPRYQGTVANFQEDLALLILTDAFEYNIYVRPACLDFNFEYEKMQENSLGNVVGWGLTGENSQPSQVLQAATLPSVPIEKCIDESPASFKSSITGDKICAGYSNGTAVCRGDSGGGLIVYGRWSYKSKCYEYHAFLRGVVSTAPTSNNECNIYTWATFTYLLRHEHFVTSILPDVEKYCIPLIIRYENQTASEPYLPNESQPRCPA